MPFSLHQCSPHTLILKCFIICCQNRRKTKGLTGNDNIQLPISQLGIKAEESLKRKKSTNTNWGRHLEALSQRHKADMSIGLVTLLGLVSESDQWKFICVSNETLKLLLQCVAAFGVYWTHFSSESDKVEQWKSVWSTQFLDQMRNSFIKPLVYSSLHL